APTWTNDGKFGKALSFDGIGDYVSVPDSTAIDTENVTVSAWINSTSSTSNLNVIEKWNTAFSPARYPYALRINNTTTGKAQFKAYDGTNNPSAESTTTINDGKWHHIVGTREDGVNLKIYVDGKLESIVTDTT